MSQQSQTESTSFVLYLGDVSAEGHNGWPERLVVQVKDSGLTVGRQYLYYGVWKFSSYSWPHNMRVGLLRLLDHAQFMADMPVYRRGDCLKARQQIFKHLENLLAS